MEITLGDQAKEVIARFKTNEITYDQCREQLKPIIDQMNVKGAEIAKKHGVKFHKFNVVGMMR